MQKIKHEKTIQTQEGNNRLELINKLDEQCIVKIMHHILKGGTTRGRWIINFVWNFFSTLSLIMRTIGSKLISEQCRWKYSAWSAFEMSSWRDWCACWCIWCCQCWWCNTGLEKDKDDDKSGDNVGEFQLRWIEQSDTNAFVGRTTEVLASF